MMTDDELKDRAQVVAQGIEIETGQIFRHYKGGLYVIVCISIKEDTMDTLITYRSNKKGTIWTRTAANFLEYGNFLGHVSHSAEDPFREELVPRFRREED
jgi:hypothetical protein